MPGARDGGLWLLRALLSVFERLGINLDSIHSSRSAEGELHFRIGLDRAATPEAQAPATAHSARASLVRGFLTNLLNPKALLFCSMFQPQFVVGSDSVGMQYLRLGTVLVLVGLLFDAMYAVLAARLARRLRGKPSPYGKFVLPTVFVLLAGRLVLG